jgi:hypothetical protein
VKLLENGSYRTRAWSVECDDSGKLKWWLPQ